MKDRNVEKIRLGSVAVDSAQVIICDPLFLKEWKGEDDHIAVHIITRDALGGELRFDNGNVGRAVVSNTGLNDGMYPVYAYVEILGNWGVRIRRVEIVFIDEQDD